MPNLPNPGFRRGSTRSAKKDALQPEHLRPVQRNNDSAPTLPSAPNATVTAGGQRAGPIPTYLRHSQKQQHRPRTRPYRASKSDCDTLPISKPSAVRTQSPAKSRGICTKTPATSLVRLSQLRNTWRPVVGRRKSRCCSRPSNKSSPHALATQGSERPKRPVPACADRSDFSMYGCLQMG